MMGGSIDEFLLKIVPAETEVVSVVVYHMGHSIEAVDHLQHTVCNKVATDALEMPEVGESSSASEEIGMRME
jgi:hypothetical protein